MLVHQPWRESYPCSSEDPHPSPNQGPENHGVVRTISDKVDAGKRVMADTATMLHPRSSAAVHSGQLLSRARSLNCSASSARRLL
jgi:hypothetical protein